MRSYCDSLNVQSFKFKIKAESFGVLRIYNGLFLDLLGCNPVFVCLLRTSSLVVSSKSPDSPYLKLY